MNKMTLQKQNKGNYWNNHQDSARGEFSPVDLLISDKLVQTDGNSRYRIAAQDQCEQEFVPRKQKSEYGHRSYSGFGNRKHHKEERLKLASAVDGSSILQFAGQIAKEAAHQPYNHR